MTHQSGRFDLPRRFQWKDLTYKSAGVDHTDEMLSVLGDSVVMRFVAPFRELSRAEVAVTAELNWRLWDEVGLGMYVCSSGDLGVLAYAGYGLWSGLEARRVRTLSEASCVDLGVLVATAHWGKGMGSVVVSGLLAVAKSSGDPRLDRVAYITNRSNESSRRLVSRLGSESAEADTIKVGTEKTLYWLFPAGRRPSRCYREQ